MLIAVITMHWIHGKRKISDNIKVLGQQSEQAIQQRKKIASRHFSGSDQLALNDVVEKSVTTKKSGQSRPIKTTHP